MIKRRSGHTLASVLLVFQMNTSEDNEFLLIIFLGKKQAWSRGLSPLFVVLGRSAKSPTPQDPAGTAFRSQASHGNGVGSTRTHLFPRCLLPTCPLVIDLAPELPLLQNTEILDQIPSSSWFFSDLLSFLPSFSLANSKQMMITIIIITQLQTNKYSEKYFGKTGRQ